MEDEVQQGSAGEREKLLSEKLLEDDLELEGGLESLPI